MRVQPNRPQQYKTRLYDGKTTSQWAQHYNVSRGAIYRRINRNGSPHIVLDTTHARHGVATHAPEKHGLSKIPEYKIYGAMITRCENPKHPQYKDYGGRGIKVCDRWRNSFVAFIKDVGRRPQGKNWTLDRVNNDGNYEPGNVQWRTRRANQRNTRANRNVCFNGVTKTVTEWSEIVGISPNSITWRLNHGVPLALALSRPAIPGKRLNRSLNAN